jgi:exodeoxyribonuclease VII large subunit
MLTARHDELERLIIAARRDVERLVSREATTIEHLRRSLTALGPSATLARGYAIVLKGDHVVRTVDEAPTGTELRIRLQDGSIHSIVTEPTDDTVES